VSTLGENLSDHTRTLVKQAFNCRIHDMYSSQEVGYMALQCPRHDHYHIQSESCLLEVLREDGTPCVPGEIGRVVVTPFHNFKMPLLRYEIGDYAISGEPCDCGIQLPVLQRIVGRSRNLVTYPDGRKSWPSYNPMALMKMFPMAQFQLEQTSLQSLRLNIAGVDVLSEPQKEQVIAIIQQAIDYAFVIDIVQVDSIERAKSGKFEEFISRIE
jgi:phenylacetate-CoA ligase